MTAPARPPAERGGGRLVSARMESTGGEVQHVPWPLVLGSKLSERVEGSSRYPWIVLGTALFGLFTTGFTITILAVSLETIAGDLDTSVNTLTWVITGPLLVFGIVGPTFGKAGDLFGHKRVYVLGLAGSAIFAIGIACSWSAGSLIAFRVLAAASGAAAGPASMALIYSVFPPQRRAQALGYWSMIGAGGPVLGVVAGGPVVEALSWRWIFVVQAPLTLFGVLVAVLLLPETTRQKGARFDVPGALLLAVTVTSLLLALNRGPVLGWSSTLVLSGFALVPLALGSFLWWEGRTPDPLLRLDYLKRRNVAAPAATQCLASFAYMGGFIITPTFLARAFDYGEARIGLLSISRPLSFAIAAPLLGYVVLRVGERAAGVAGSLAVAASMVGLASVRPGVSDLVVIGSLALSGIGLGASAPAMTALVANAVDSDDLGVAGATSQLLVQVGTVAGIQLMQTVQVARLDSAGLAGSYASAYLLGGAVALVGAAAALFVRRSAPYVSEDDIPLASTPAESEAAVAG